MPLRETEILDSQDSATPDLPQVLLRSHPKDLPLFTHPASKALPNL